MLRRRQVKIRAPELAACSPAHGVHPLKAHPSAPASHHQCSPPPSHTRSRVRRYVRAPARVPPSLPPAATSRCFAGGGNSGLAIKRTAVSHASSPHAPSLPSLYWDSGARLARQRAPTPRACAAPQHSAWPKLPRQVAFCTQSAARHHVNHSRSGTRPARPATRTPASPTPAPPRCAPVPAAPPQAQRPPPPRHRRRAPGGAPRRRRRH